VLLYPWFVRFAYRQRCGHPARVIRHLRADSVIHVRIPGQRNFCAKISISGGRSVRP
jgi:hypothetical protein